MLRRGLMEILEDGFGKVQFGEAPTASTLVGGLLISAATLWLTRRESHRRVRETGTPTHGPTAETPASPTER